MQRRTLLAAPLAVLVPVGRSKPKSPRPARPRCRGILMLVYRPAHFKPTSWRDVPDGPFEVDCCLPPRSLAECRAVAKETNSAWLKTGAPLWLIVVATDGRLPKNATPATKGGVA